MKKVRLIFPPNMADAIAELMYNNAVRVLLSWSTDDFFDTKIVVIAGVPPEAETTFLVDATISKYIKK